MKKQIHSSKDIGHALRAVRRSSKVRLDDLAMALGVSKQTTSNIEMGKPTVQIGTVLRHLEEMGVYVFVDIPESAKSELEKLLAADSAEVRDE